VSQLDLESVLSKHLGRETAPEELSVGRLFKLQAGFQPALSRPRTKAWGTPALAGVAAVAVFAILFLWFRPPSSDLHSADPAQISAWLKSRSFDVPLRTDPPQSIRLTAAHIKGSTAEVDYRIGGHDAVLTVSPPSAQAPDPGTYHIVRSHLVRGQLFTLACAFPEDARMACLLCHMGAQVN